MSKITKITAFFLFFVMCFCVQNASAAISFDGPIAQLETCTTEGATQKKYTASGCTYETETRTCCGGAIKTWSGWDEDCPDTTCTSCSSATKPSTSQECTMSNGSTGTQTRTVTCDTSTCTWSKGSWGACKCNKTCSGSDILDSGTCQCCWAGCYLFSGAGACNCVNGSYALDTQCCTMTNGQEYQLPASYSDCSTFASKIGLTVKPGIALHMCSRLAI